MTELVLKKPAWLEDRVVVAVDTFPDEHIYHIVDFGEYKGRHDHEEAIQWLSSEFGMTEKRARRFLAYATNFYCGAFDPSTDEMVADRWDVSDLLPHEAWSELYDWWS